METDLFEFAYVPDWYGQLEELEGLVLPEPWKFKRPSVEMKNQDTLILERYIHKFSGNRALTLTQLRMRRRQHGIFMWKMNVRASIQGYIQAGIRQSMVFSTGIKGVIPCWTGISGGSAMRFHRG